MASAATNTVRLQNARQISASVHQRVHPDGATRAVSFASKESWAHIYLP